MSIFEKTWWHHSPGAGTGSQHTYRQMTLDKIFKSADKHSLVILDACDELAMQGYFLVVGKELNFHVIRDGRVIFFAEGRDFDNFYYPYNPIDHPFEFNRVSRLQTETPVKLW